MDVEAAFLNGLIETDVHVKQTIGFDDKTGRVYKLKKPYMNSEKVRGHGMNA